MAQSRERRWGHNTNLGWAASLAATEERARQNEAATIEWLKEEEGCVVCMNFGSRGGQHTEDEGCIYGKGNKR